MVRRTHHAVVLLEEHVVDEDERRKHGGLLLRRLGVEQRAGPLLWGGLSRAAVGPPHASKADQAAPRSGGAA